MRLTTSTLLLATLARVSTAQFARFVPPSDSSITYRVNVPASTANSGSGPIFFQITGPSSKQWIALGQGQRMAGAHIYVVYADGKGNVTVSPRLGTGHIEPQFNSDARVTLLAGSGIVNGQMVANVRCDNCLQMANVRATDSRSTWLFAVKDGDPLDSTSTSAEISQHDNNGLFVFDLTQATGGNSANPFVAAAPSPSSARTGTGSNPTSNPSGAPSSPSDTAAGNYDSGSDSESSGAVSIVVTDTARMLKIHGILMGLAFAVLFPLGAIILRLLPSPHKVHIHMAVQFIAFILAIAGLSYGVMLAEDFALLKNKHPVIGMIVMGGLFFQPIVGLIHHWLFKVKGKRTILAYIHTYWGRALMILGIINGGLGLQLANNTSGGKVAYAVVAGIMGGTWLASAGVYYARGGSKAALAAREAERKETASDGENGTR
ncbi:hypothetical protein Dda_2302 [Drechslerella dactyloides]|uniref:Cytochrome b561 domain-containing protein n=1 Tax=Drechslerella dactyloides TaxID=74499 RepID=A0AAD6J4M3_DREDA|nr:hypothetical protein Dda_2302 [Drechslerella dactyloides]